MDIETKSSPKTEEVAEIEEDLLLQVSRWKQRIYEEFRDDHDTLRSETMMPEKVMKKLFSNMNKIENNVYAVFFDRTYFYLVIEQDGFTLKLDKKVNAIPAWHDNRPTTKSGRKFITVQTAQKRGKKEEPSLRRKRKKVSETEEEVVGEKSEESTIIVEGKEGIIWDSKAWLKKKLGKEAIGRVPVGLNTEDKELEKIEIPSMTSEDIFGVSIRWMEYYKRNLGWPNTNGFDILKRCQEDLNANQVKEILTEMSKGIVELSSALSSAMALINVLVRKVNDINIREDKSKEDDKRNQDKIKQIQKDTKIMSKQLNSSTILGNNATRTFKTNPRLDPIRQAIAKKNIAKYKKENTWIEESQWRNLTHFQKIMKRWTFSDTHQCLSPYDEEKLTEQERKEFHEKKRQWRANRRTELERGGVKSGDWLMRRFNKYCHVRIINDRMWTGLDLKYEEDIGINNPNNNNYRGITWKSYKSRKKWHAWKSLRRNTESLNSQ